MSDISAGRSKSPSQLVLVRHAESMGNLADQVAREKGARTLDLDTRDADTTLSDTGKGQAAAVARWVAELGDKPDIVLTSPYRRAHDTARIVMESIGLDDRLSVDERLRERDLGVLDRMTGTGIREKFPDEAARRDEIGKFYYRPPGGESWTDVVLRVRHLLTDIRNEYDDKRVWVFTHQAVIMSFRYAIEGLDEQTLLGIDRDSPMANCSVTTYCPDDAGALALDAYADTTAVDSADVDRTHEESEAEATDA